MSIFEKVHALNRAIEALHTRGIPTPKIMLGTAGDVYRLTEIYLNSTNRTHDYRSIAEVHSALDTRLASVRSVAALFERAEVA